MYLILIRKINKKVSYIVKQKKGRKEGKKEEIKFKKENKGIGKNNKRARRKTAYVLIVNLDSFLFSCEFCFIIFFCDFTPFFL